MIGIVTCYDGYGHDRYTHAECRREGQRCIRYRPIVGPWIGWAQHAGSYIPRTKHLARGRVVAIDAGDERAIGSLIVPGGGVGTKFIHRLRPCRAPAAPMAKRRSDTAPLANLLEHTGKVVLRRQPTRQRPGVEDIIDQIVAGLRSSCTYAGAASLEEFHDRAVVGVQSSAGYDEGRPLGTSW